MKLNIKLNTWIWGLNITLQKALGLWKYYMFSSNICIYLCFILPRELNTKIGNLLHSLTLPLGKYHIHNVTTCSELQKSGSKTFHMFINLNKYDLLSYSSLVDGCQEQMYIQPLNGPMPSFCVNWMHDWIFYP